MLTTFSMAALGRGEVQTAALRTKLALKGQVFTVLHAFSGVSIDNEDGSLPNGPLIFGKDGGLYGLSGMGGESGMGGLFKVSTDGHKFYALHGFTPEEGGYPRTGLLLGRDGNLYGVCAHGDAKSGGTIFRVTLPAATRKTNLPQP